MEEILTNPWFILITIISILAMIFMVIRFFNGNKKDDQLLFDRLRDAEININIKKPIYPSGSNVGNTDIQRR